MSKLENVKRWQTKQKRLGNCIFCGSTGAVGNLCEPCRIKKRITRRQEYRRAHGIPLNRKVNHKTGRKPIVYPPTTI